MGSIVGRDARIFHRRLTAVNGSGRPSVTFGVRSSSRPLEDSLPTKNGQSRPRLPCPSIICSGNWNAGFMVRSMRAVQDGLGEQLVEARGGEGEEPMAF